MRFERPSWAGAQSRSQLAGLARLVGQVSVRTRQSTKAAPSEPGLFEVWIDGQPVPQAGSCAEDGWVWSVPHSEVTLCGSACDLLKETGKVQALYFCNPG